MKIIKKISITLLGLCLATSLYFSCSNSSTSETPEQAASEETSAASDTPESTEEEVNSATYIAPTLPASVGTDPFKGHTYTSSNGYKTYTFGNNGDLTYRTREGDGRKYQYTYNETKEELSLKITHEYDVLDNGEPWCTYNQIYDFYHNLSYSDYVNSTNQNEGTILSETEFNQFIQDFIDYYRLKFETIFVYKAQAVDLDSDEDLDLKLSKNYYTTAPSQLPWVEKLTFSDGNNFSMTIRPNNGGEPGHISYRHESTTTRFTITNLTSNTITAKELEGDNIKDDGLQLNIGYSNLKTGNNHILEVTMTGADDATNTIFTTWFNNTRMTLSTSISYEELYLN